MDAVIRGRLQRLAGYIQGSQADLTMTPYLVHRGQPYPGYNILGLICDAYQSFTGDGRWMLSRRDVPELPDFVAGGDMEDQRLPKSVADYFGFRDQIGSFYVGELTQDVKNKMRHTRKTEGFALRDVSFYYRRNGKEIAARIIRAMPSSLLKPEISEPKGSTHRVPGRR